MKLLLKLFAIELRDKNKNVTTTPFNLLTTARANKLARGFLVVTCQPLYVISRQNSQTVHKIQPNFLSFSFLQET